MTVSFTVYAESLMYKLVIHSQTIYEESKDFELLLDDIVDQVTFISLMKDLSESHDFDY